MTTFPESLLAGYRSFRGGRLVGERDRYRRLAEEGQRPTAMAIACCDSRAAPETIFDAGPGELFVLRNVANLVPPPDAGDASVSSALEFAVLGLGVQHILVLGHARCGGVQAALATGAEPLSPGDHVGKWKTLLEPAARTLPAGLSAAERQTALERASIRRSLANLRGFPFVASLEERGELALHGAWFDIATGELWLMDARTGAFSRAE